MICNNHQDLCLVTVCGFMLSLVSHPHLDTGRETQYWRARCLDTPPAESLPCVPRRHTYPRPNSLSRTLIKSSRFHTTGPYVPCLPSQSKWIRYGMSRSMAARRLQPRSPWCQAVLRLPVYALRFCVWRFHILGCPESSLCGTKFIGISNPTFILSAPKFWKEKAGVPATLSLASPSQPSTPGFPA